MNAFPLEVLKMALAPPPEEGPPAPMMDLGPVIDELRKIHAVMSVVAKQPRAVVA